MPNPLFDVHYADGRTSVAMVADLKRGWNRLQKTYGFFQQTRIPFKNDLVIRAQLSLIAQPGNFGEWAREFPDLEIQGESAFPYTIRNRRLEVKVRLASDQPWRTTAQGRPEIFISEQPFIRRDDWTWYDLRIWLIWHEPGMRPIPDVRVWVESKLFVPGGQIESNRRRH